MSPEKNKRPGLTTEAWVSLWAALLGLAGLGLLMAFDGLPILKAVCVSVILTVLVHHFLGGVDTHISARGVRAAGSTGFLLIAVWFLNSEFERQGNPDVDYKKLAEVVAPAGTPEDVAETAEDIVEALEHPVALPSQSLADADIDTLIVNNAAFAEFSDAADHWYRFDIDTADTYSIRTWYPVGDGPPVDTEIFLYGDNLLFDPGARWLGEDDDGGEGTYSFLTEHLDTGTYYLQVSSYYGSPGRYAVAVEASDLGEALVDSSVDAVDDPLELPPEFPPLDAEQIAADGETVSNHFDGNEVHWYILVIDQPGVYSISTSGEETGPDTVIEFLDSNGDMIGYDDDGAGIGLYSLLSEELLPGVYYIGVTSYLDLPGTYALAVASEPPT
ncbi:MAG: hypothetical protein F4Y41_03760 [Gammaproteobacteria bacterium]|nr:hypothetical protein [Gammaproteobacteria bacterium]